jgi:hypothetical protein
MTTAQEAALTDDDLDLDGEETADETSEPEAHTSGELPEWAQKEIAKARREAAKYRNQLRRTELAKEYGDDVLELVPETMKLDEQKALAAKLAERLRIDTPNPTEQETPEPPKVEVPAGLAAVAGSTAAGAAAPSAADHSARELGEMMKSDPAAALRLMEAKYRNP